MQTRHDLGLGRVWRWMAVLAGWQNLEFANGAVSSIRQDITAHNLGYMLLFLWSGVLKYLTFCILHLTHRKDETIFI
jgi:hypothetical protein